MKNGGGFSITYLSHYIHKRSLGENVRAYLLNIIKLKRLSICAQKIYCAQFTILAQGTISLLIP